MFLDKKIKVVDIIEGKNSIGEPYKIETTTKTVKCIIQPVKFDLEYKQYGIYTNEIYNVYTTEIMAIGTTIKYKGEKFVLREVKDYGKLQHYVIEKM